ncbi:hypothetical protein AURDEDRAFT_158201 [Auricularia subglabra TFB-10046 SS5]|nr:hypothetical protein AURDEDRAFT_158201 [Auricularia subglabra TFB-10046 SS5]
MHIISVAFTFAIAALSASAQCWPLESGTIVCNPVKTNLTSGCVELLSGTVGFKLAGVEQRTSRL